MQRNPRPARQDENIAVVPNLNTVEEDSFQGVRPQNVSLPSSGQPNQGNQSAEENEEPPVSVPKHYTWQLTEYPHSIIKSGSFRSVTKVFSPLIGTGALKKLHNNFLNTRDLNNWRREFASLFQLNHHPNIVTLYGYVFENEGDAIPIGILMEFMIGGNLDDFILKYAATNKYKVIEQIKNTWAKQIALGLNFIHSRNIMHRDLKPENILLSQNRMIAKIADFGFSRRIDTSGVHTMGVGNPMYAAPEVYMETGTYSIPADVWSYGMILYFIYYMRHPYNFEILKKIAPLIRVRVWRGEEQNDRMPVRPVLGEHNIDTIIELCWQTNPEKRPPMSVVVNNLYSDSEIGKFPSLNV